MAPVAAGEGRDAWAPRALSKAVGAVRVPIRSAVAVVGWRGHAAVVVGGGAEVVDGAEMKLDRILQDLLLPQVGRKAIEDAMIDRVGVERLNRRLGDQEFLGRRNCSRVFGPSTEPKSRHVRLAGRRSIQALNPAVGSEELARGVQIPSVSRNAIQLEGDFGEQRARLGVHQSCPRSHGETGRTKRNRACQQSTIPGKVRGVDHQEAAAVERRDGEIRLR
ncbi:hypothetical protein C2845_PM06G02970 [Panicum miliaceum]|uniref:Uncharacterized protein n=1 Tax=Panicum miliaceum TaxID=4540 RepID=A0A3L6RBA3_PANMI|nr:hypothetical protein C2845_PM06G02970 [Panicum miliaceum]